MRDPMSPAATPLRQRPLDLILVVCFSLFAFTSLMIDSLSALDADLATTWNPLGRAVLFYGESCDPFFLVNPPIVQFMTGVSAVIFGPFAAVVAWGLARQRPWIRTPGLVYAGALAYSTLTYMALSVLSALPPTNYGMFLGSNGPYVAVPLLLAWRLRRPVAPSTDPPPCEP